MSTKPRKHIRSAWTPMLDTLLLIVVAIAVILAIIGLGHQALLLLALIGVLVAAMSALALVESRVLSRHRGDVHSAEEDGEESTPALFVDSEVPLGATAEAHDDLENIDLPLDHPARNLPGTKVDG